MLHPRILTLVSLAHAIRCSLLTVGFGTTKAGMTYAGYNTSPPTTLEWIVGAFRFLVYVIPVFILWHRFRPVLGQPP